MGFFKIIVGKILKNLEIVSLGQIMGIKFNMREYLIGVVVLYEFDV